MNNDDLKQPDDRESVPSITNDRVICLTPTTDLRQYARRSEDRELTALRERIKHLSVIELMCENVNVKAHIIEWEDRCLKAESELAALKRDLREIGNAVLIGGNHLASQLIGHGCMPNNYSDYSQVLESCGQPAADIWAGWNSIMQFREAILAKHGV
jgi:hypothetical protein